jgi:hypothetical protein
MTQPTREIDVPRPRAAWGPAGAVRRVRDVAAACRMEGQKAPSMRASATPTGGWLAENATPVSSTGDNATSVPAGCPSQAQLS